MKSKCKKQIFLAGVIQLFLFGCSNYGTSSQAFLRDPDPNLDPRWKGVKTFAQSIYGTFTSDSFKEGKILLELDAFDFDDPAKDGSPLQMEYSLTLKKNISDDTGYSNFSGLYRCGDPSCEFGVITVRKISGQMAGEAHILFVQTYSKNYEVKLGTRTSTSALGLAATALKKYKGDFNLSLFRVQDGVLDNTFSALYYDPPENQLPYDWVTYFISDLPSSFVEVSHHQLKGPDLQQTIANGSFDGSLIFNQDRRTLSFAFESDVLKSIEIPLSNDLSKFISNFFKL